VVQAAVLLFAQRVISDTRSPLARSRITVVASTPHTVEHSVVKEDADLVVNVPLELCSDYSKVVVAMDELPMKRLDVPPKTSLGEAARLTGPKHSEHSNQ
jgi:hypothetical protein